MAVQLRLVRSDFPSQVRLRLGKPMRTVRDPPDHRNAGLGTPSTGQGRLLTFAFGTSASPHLLSNFLRRLADALRPIAAISQPCRQPVPVIVALIARAGGLLGGV